MQPKERVAGGANCKVREGRRWLSRQLRRLAVIADWRPEFPTLQQEEVLQVREVPVPQALLRVPQERRVLRALLQLHHLQKCGRE